MSEPNTLQAGDTITWSRSLTSYPATAGWVLKYRLLFTSGTPVDITATASGADHAVSLAATATAGYTPGAATLVPWVELGAERYTLDPIAVTVLANLAGATSYDGRTQNQRILQAAKAALETYMASGKLTVAEYELAGRRMRFRDLAHITETIATYERLVAADAARALAASGVAAGRVITRM